MDVVNELDFDETISLMLRRNKVGPRTEPWRTPAMVKLTKERMFMNTNFRLLVSEKAPNSFADPKENSCSFHTRM